MSDPRRTLHDVCEQVSGRKLGCYHCGKSYLKTHSSNIYCSVACRDAAEANIPQGYLWECDEEA